MQREFNREDDFWLLKSAAYDPMTGVLRVFIKDTDDESKYARQAYTYHDVNEKQVRSLFSKSKGRQKEAWKSLRDNKQDKEDPDVMNHI